jgi:hypothetical protein
MAAHATRCGNTFRHTHSDLEFDYFSTPLRFVGLHALTGNLPMSASNHLARLSIPDANQVLALPERAIVNPGSVGQPRDRDPRAAFALFDTETNLLDYRRVPYDFTEVQDRMAAAGLPKRHIQRLAAGW